MDNAQKAIMIGVGLFITIIVIAAVMLITGMGQDLLNSGTQQISNISDSLQAQLTASYDDSTLTGAQVIAAVKNYYTDASLILIVDNKKNTTERYDYGKLHANTNPTLSGTNYTVESTTQTAPNSTSGTGSHQAVGTMSDSSKTASTYIPSTAKYNAKLIKIKDTNDVVGIYFKRNS